MKNRKWLTIYSDNGDNIQTGIYPDDDDKIAIEFGREGQYADFGVKLQVSEVEDLISFLQTLINDLTEEE